MSPVWWLAVAVAGAAGAVCRYLVDLAVRGRVPGPWPWGTFVVNVTGSFLFGLVAGAAGDLVPGDAAWVLAVGFCGSYTTFSTHMYETVRLGQEGRLAGMAGSVVGSLAVGVIAAGAGWALTS